MKEIVAIIRPKNVGATRAALEELGFPGMTASAVLGRGHQRGIGGEISPIIGAPPADRTPGAMKYIPKRMLTIVVPDEEVGPVVDAIVAVNKTSQIGDGKIFICPIDGAMRVRTGESGNDALL